MVRLLTFALVYIDIYILKPMLDDKNRQVGTAHRRSYGTRFGYPFHAINVPCHLYHSRPRETASGDRQRRTLGAFGAYHSPLLVSTRYQLLISRQK